MGGSLSFTRGRRRLVRHSRQRHLVAGWVRSRVDGGSVIVGSVPRPGSGDRKARTWARAGCSRWLLV